MTRHVFLSFVKEDLDSVNLFRGQAKNQNNDLEFDDYSIKEPVDSNDVYYIQQEIRDKLNMVSVTLCLIGRDTHRSPWVDWEIQESVDMGKGLVGVKLDNDSVVPRALRENDGIIVGWNHDAIIDAINDAAQ